MSPKSDTTPAGAPFKTITTELASLGRFQATAANCRAVSNILLQRKMPLRLVLVVDRVGPLDRWVIPMDQAVADRDVPRVPPQEWVDQARELACRDLLPVSA